MSKAKVIDTHAHLGECCVFGLMSTKEEMLRRMDESAVDATIVQPYPGAKDYYERHNEIAALCEEYPGRFFGLASLSPHIGRERYRKEVERCVKELKFVGVKLHTIGHGVNPLSEDGQLVFETAYDLGIAAMVHTGAGIPFALPALCIPAARKYPGLNIVLAHAGGGIVSAEAQVAASICSNLYLETSWCLGEDIRWMIESIGPDRVMMGADLPSNVPVEIAKYRALDLRPDVIDMVLGETAVNVFNLSWPGENVADGSGQESSNGSSETKE